VVKQSGRPPRGKRAASARPARPQSGAQQKGAKKQAPKKQPAAQPETPPVDLTPRTFRLGAVPGATPGRWIDTWQERMPHVTLKLVPISVATQRDELAGVDAALVRTPIARADGLHVIPLYDEVPVVVASADSHLLAVDHLTADDLVGEVLITPGDDVLGPLDLPTVAPDFPTIRTTEDAVATVASGVGILVVPMSLARLHRRKDVDYRPLLAGPVSPVALAWPRERTSPDVETFVGIVRGRTANSSRQD
jgi:DNA-binding transcriptional LysR family regulator